jgi:transmembrane sensor
MPEDHHEAREEAAQWLTKIDRGLSAEEGSSLRHWLKRSWNREAIADLARSWHAPEAIALLSELISTNLQPRARRHRREAATMLIAAVGAACIVVFATLIFNDQRIWAHLLAARAPTHDASGRPHVPLAKDTYTTLVGEQRHINLPDGSGILLNTNSNVVVTYSLTERHVQLTYGEASFQVAHETERPFLVRAGRQHRFQAVGTRFTVRVLTPDTVALIVTEGTVKVFHTSLTEPETPAFARLQDNMVYEDTNVDAPEMVQVEPGLQFDRKLGPSEANDLLAWQRGRLVFRGERLEDVLAEVDRYTNARFVPLEDPLRNLRIAGDFRTGHIEDLLGSLRKNYLVDWQRDRDGRIELRPLAPRTNTL